MKMKMQVIGEENVIRNISLWQKVRFPKEIRKAINVTRLKIEDDARRLAPKDTGALKASIWSKMVGSYSAVIGDGVYYGIFQEKGTSRNPPHSFLIPAFEIGKKKLERELKEMLR